MLKVVLVGTGTMGRVHAEAYAGMDDVSLIGAASVDPVSSQVIAEKHHIPVYSSIEDLLSNTDADIVDVCVPTYLHKEMVVKAAEAGKHVICEKPLSRNLEDARIMIDTCRDNGVQLFVGHVVRFFPEYVRAKELVDNGSVGSVGVVHARRGGPMPSAWKDWYAGYALSGGLSVDLIIHDFDFLRWTFGEVERVFAKGTKGRDVNRLEYVLATLRFKNGVIAHVEGTWAHPGGFYTKLEIAGSIGIIEFDSRKAAPLSTVVSKTEQGSVSVAVPETPSRQNPYAKELRHFVNCIKTGETPRVSAEDAYKALEISLAALESIETGQPVRLG